MLGLEKIYEKGEGNAEKAGVVKKRQGVGSSSWVGDEPS